MTEEAHLQGEGQVDDLDRVEERSWKGWGTWADRTSLWKVKGLSRGRH